MQNLNALTIDLEDWYHAPISIAEKVAEWGGYENRVVRNTTKLLALLTKANVRATFFVLGHVAKGYPDLIRQISECGHEIGLHSFNHQRVSTISKQTFREDVQKNLDVIQQIINKKVIGYRAPMFSIDEKSLSRLEILENLGLQYDSSIYPIQNPFYGIQSAPRHPYHPIEGSKFVEFPIATLRLLGTNIPCGGGFYLRAFPYRIIQTGIRQLNKKGYPAVIYFHPWEFDHKQAFQRLTLREQITHYYGRTALKPKFMRLLGEFKFTPLSRHLENYQYNP